MLTDPKDTTEMIQPYFGKRHYFEERKSQFVVVGTI
jgi:hypothetical protein